jgi:hypothetical protein
MELKKNTDSEEISSLRDSKSSMSTMLNTTTRSELTTSLTGLQKKSSNSSDTNQLIVNPTLLNSMRAYSRIPMVESIGDNKVKSPQSRIKHHVDHVGPSLLLKLWNQLMPLPSQNNNLLIVQLNLETMVVKVVIMTTLSNMLKDTHSKLSKTMPTQVEMEAANTELTWDKSKLPAIEMFKNIACLN